MIPSGRSLIWGKNEKLALARAAQKVSADPIVGSQQPRVEFGCLIHTNSYSMCNIHDQQKILTVDNGMIIHTKHAPIHGLRCEQAVLIYIL